MKVVALDYSDDCGGQIVHVNWLYLLLSSARYRDDGQRGEHGK